MKFDISFDRVYPHAIETVWDALTNPDALGQWLMRTDFAAEQGRPFRMWCETKDGGTDEYDCKVLEIDPPRRMLWSWILDGRQKDGETLVEYSLEETDDGTRLTIRHSGDRDEATIEAFKGGWKAKLDALGEVFGN